MRWKTGKSTKTPKSRPFLVLPLIEVDNSEEKTMRKKPTDLRLFTKTFAPNEKHVNDENERPLTATLEKPQVLDIRLITKIDMSLVRKEFLCITNLCRVPITVSKVRRKIPIFNQRRHCKTKPLILPNKGLQKISRPGTSDDSWEDESSSSQTPTGAAKKQANLVRKHKMIKQPVTVPTSPTKRQSKNTSQNDNNNNFNTYRVTKKHIVVPQPCNACGRPDQPERFHSHPETPAKSTKKMSEKVAAKNSVQKPIAIKYKSKSVEKKSAPSPRKPVSIGKVASAPIVKEEPPKKTVDSEKRPRTVTCYICGRQFGTMSLPLHEPKCLEKWDRENASLPSEMRRKRPVKPEKALNKQEYNNHAWEAAQANLVPCKNCKRTFYPDRLAVHQRSCKSAQPQTMIELRSDQALRDALIKLFEMALEKSKSIEANIHRLSLTAPENLQPLESIEEEEKSKTLCEKAKLIFTNITVEPMMVCYILPSVMASLAVQNLNLEKACRVNLQYNDTICDALQVRNSSGYDIIHEVTVQKLVASMNAWKNIIQSILPTILLMFIGSWSDRHNRRKPCIMLPLAGELTSCVCYLICTYFFFQLPMEVNAIAESVPPAITGGWFCMFLGVFSYISTISTKEMRTLRIGAVSMFSNVSVTIGTALSGVLYRQIGFYGVFSLAATVSATGMTYGFFRVHEQTLRLKADENGENDTKENEKHSGKSKDVERGSKSNENGINRVTNDIEHDEQGIRHDENGTKRDEKENNCDANGIKYEKNNIREGREDIVSEAKGEIENSKKKSFLADFFDVRHISDTFKVAFKTGSRNRRKRVCTIMILVMVIIGPLYGEFNVMYLFVRYKFGWDEMDYAFYSTFNIICHMCGTLFSLMFFSKFLKLDDALLGVISSLSKVASAVVFAFAPTPFFFYIGAIVEMLNGTSFIAMRSITSKLVPPDELGKINSLFGVSEALMPLVYGPMYSLVYNTTIKVFPGSFLLLGGFLTMPAVFIFLWLYREHKMDAKEEEINKQQAEKLLSK